MVYKRWIHPVSQRERLFHSMVMLIHLQSQNVVWPTKFITSNLILMAGPSLLKDWRSLCLSVPIWATEGSTCPPLIPLAGDPYSVLTTPNHTQHTPPPASPSTALDPCQSPFNKGHQMGSWEPSLAKGCLHGAHCTGGGEQEGVG